jgi:hypothetical protein
VKGKRRTNHQGKDPRHRGYPKDPIEFYRSHTFILRLCLRE